MGTGQIVMLVVLVLLIFGVWRLIGVKGRLRRKLRSVAGFQPTMVRLGGKKTHSLAIDPASNRFVVARLWGKPRVFDFADLVAVEVLRNGDALTTTDRGSQFAGAAVGAILAGPIGLLVGGLSGKKRQSQKVSRLSVRIVANDLENPTTEVVFLSVKGLGLDPTSTKARKYAAEVSEWHGRFQAILHGQGSATAEQGLAQATK